ncbi:MAG: hypothetical protein JWP01_2505 [Myxococcales bacterium]|nr:hypothetical protein [Myxococcales bacterium]
MTARNMAARSTARTRALTEQGVLSQADLDRDEADLLQREQDVNAAHTVSLAQGSIVSSACGPGWERCMRGGHGETGCP